jgi:hypothetical protein
MSKMGGSQKLKDQNRWQLWLIIGANAVVFYGACQWETFELSGVKAALAGAANLLPVGLAIVVTTVAKHVRGEGRHLVTNPDAPRVNSVSQNYFCLL